jgi:hypothetical protein
MTEVVGGALLCFDCLESFEEDAKDGEPASDGGV